MTLKTQTSELSQRAKAFSVESLLNVKKGQEVSGSKTETDTELLTRNDIRVELCSRDLWKKFDSIGTEMIVTRAGRRMFPTLKVRIQGLNSSTTYIVYLDIILVDETKYRYNYHSCEWTVVGPSTNVSSASNMYIHPESPCKGEIWTSRGCISFDKVKLTNHRTPLIRDQISLQSMHKYQPRIHILEVREKSEMEKIRENMRSFIERHSGRRLTFVFEETTFITVTAYQNQKITNLKILSNPFAKGFREIYRIKRKEREKKCESTPSTNQILHSPFFRFEPRYFFTQEDNNKPFGIQ